MLNLEASEASTVYYRILFTTKKVSRAKQGATLGLNTVRTALDVDHI